MDLSINPQDFHRAGYDGHHVMKNFDHLTDWKERDWWHGHRDAESESVTYVGRPANGVIAFKTSGPAVTATELSDALQQARARVSSGAVKVRGVVHYHLIVIEGVADTFYIGIEDWVPSKFGERPA